MNKKLISAVIIAVSAFILVILFPFTELLELKTVDMRFSVRGTRQPDPRIVIVKIDEKSFRDMDVRWPWPRFIFGAAVKAISDDGAIALGFDIELSERGFGTGEDENLANAFAGSGIAVIPEKLWQSSENGIDAIHLDVAEDIFLESSRAQGFVNLPVDSDGFVRRVLTYEIFNKNIHRPLSLATLSLLSDKDYLAEVPTKRALDINFAGPSGTFSEISFSEVYKKQFEPGFFDGKIVLLGATFKEAHDTVPTPFFQDQEMAGVEVHANIINTVLQSSYLSTLSPALNMALAAVAIIGIVVFGMFYSPMRTAFLAGGYMAAWILFSVIMFSRGNTIIPIADNVLAALWVYIGVLIYHYGVERNRRREITGVFSRFVSPSVVSQLIDSNSPVQLGGEIREVTLFFSDIRGFTTLSEQMAPDEVVQMLNEYFTAMTEVLFRWEGTLNKFIGDAIFAFFGAPVDLDDSAIRATRAVLEMREALALFNQERDGQGKQPIRIGMGLHKGRVLVGNIGSVRQMEYTVIGDAVNVCSRIESYTKTAATDILISDSVYSIVKDSVTVETLEPVLLKGKNEPVLLHKLQEGHFT